MVQLYVRLYRRRNDYGAEPPDAIKNSVPPPLRSVGILRLLAFFLDGTLFIILEMIYVKRDLRFNMNAAARRIRGQSAVVSNRIDGSFGKLNFVKVFRLEFLFVRKELGSPVRLGVDAFLLEIRGDDRLRRQSFQISP